MSKESNWQGENRRVVPRIGDKLYRIVLFLNGFAWICFIAAMIVFHYARPELISGVQEYWGVEGRENWSMTLSFYLMFLLSISTFMSLVVLILKSKRSRRRNDYMGINIVILFIIAASSLTWIYIEMNN
jgi:uncharacterized membrane protein YqjE